jgi:uncharacterized SAM-binding protein YcdF (DUF218 family)
MHMLLLLQLKTLLRNLLLPPVSPLILAMLGIFLMKRRPSLARLLLVIGIGSLWLFSTPVISDGLTALAERYPALDPQRAADGQAIVILGGGGERAFAPEYQGPAADPILLERLAYGAYLAGKTKLPILVTGYRLEAVAMRDTLIRIFNITPRWVDDRSFDTFQNAHNSAQVLNADGIKRIVLVTAGTHMGRSVQEFTATGLEVIPAPAGVLTARDFGIERYVPGIAALGRSYTATYELIGEPVRRFLAATHLRRQ